MKAEHRVEVTPDPEVGSAAEVFVTKTTDGRHWVFMGPDWRDVEIETMEVTESSGWIYLGLRAPPSYATGVESVVYRSTTQGETWESIGGTIKASVVHAFANAREFPSRVYAATDSGLYVSPTGGDDWRQMMGGPAHLVATALAMVSGSLRFLFVGTEAGEIYRIAPDIPTNVETQSVGPTKGHTLEQNYPNPFNSQTSISFALPKVTNATVTIYNLAGQRVRSMELGELPSGTHRVVWDGLDDDGKAVQSGVFVYVLTAGRDIALSKKLMLLK